MAVRCTGDARLIEQVGEKQDFECELTLHGLRHEDFVLLVERPEARGDDAAWSHDYSVTVVDTRNGRSRAYAGGPRHNWVRRFAEDVARGLHRGPDVRDTGPEIPPGRRRGDSFGERRPG
jgi:hypothetical protein